MVSAVIVAGGRGARMGAEINKVLLPLMEKEIISRTVAVFENTPQIAEIIIVTAERDIDAVKSIIERDGYEKIAHITCGGSTRQKSVHNGLRLASGDVVLIHDGARCMITRVEIESVIADTLKFGAAASGVKVKDTLKTIDGNGNIIATVDREQTVHIHTPQGFATAEILSLHERAAKDLVSVTDDCALFEHYGKTVHLTLGSYDNIKVTTPEDIIICENILKGRSL